MAAMTIFLEDPFHGVSKLNDRELTLQVEQLNQRRQGLDADLLLHLSELDYRGLYRGQACSSLFAYCTERLGFSEDAAYKRVSAARILRQFPLVYELLLKGKIHLSALLLLKPHLTETNHSELLHSACGMSKRAVEKLVAALAPRPDVPTRVRNLPEATPAASPVAASSAIAIEHNVPILQSCPVVVQTTAQESTPSTPIPVLRDLAPTARAPGPTSPLAGATNRSLGKLEVKLRPNALATLRLRCGARSGSAIKVDAPSSTPLVGGVASNTSSRSNIDYRALCMALRPLRIAYSSVEVTTRCAPRKSSARQRSPQG